VCVKVHLRRGCARYLTWTSCLESPDWPCREQRQRCQLCAVPLQGEEISEVGVEDRDSKQPQAPNTRRIVARRQHSFAASSAVRGHEGSLLDAHGPQLRGSSQYFHGQPGHTGHTCDNNVITYVQKARIEVQKRTFAVVSSLSDKVPPGMSRQVFTQQPNMRARPRATLNSSAPHQSGARVDRAWLTLESRTLLATSNAQVPRPSVRLCGETARR
jgi:hypothetical protein